MAFQSRPEHAFFSAGHTWLRTENEGVFQSRESGAEIRLTRERQQAPHSLVDESLTRAVGAWLIARGVREINLNEIREPIGPEWLERPQSWPGPPLRRVVSIAPSNAEIMAALGAESLLVGVDSGTDYPPGITGLPRLGSELYVDMEALAALQPDLVLASLTVPGMERNVTILERMEIPLLIAAPLSLADIGRDMQRTGDAIGYGEAARNAVNTMERGFAALQAARAGLSSRPVRVFLQWWHHPMFTPGAACWSNELIESAGGVNVFRHLPAQSAEVTPQQVVEADPEVIFLSWCGVPFSKLNPERVLRRKDLSSVTAIAKERVHPLDEALLGRPGPRLVQGAARMAELIAGVGG